MESKLATIETDVKNLKEEVKDIKTRLDENDKEIDALSVRTQELTTDIVVMRKDIESISDGVKRVEVTVNKTSEKLDQLKDQRIQDHFEKPLDNRNKIIWQIITIVVGLLVAFVMGSLFPILVK